MIGASGLANAQSAANVPIVSIEARASAATGAAIVEIVRDKRRRRQLWWQPMGLLCRQRSSPWLRMQRPRPDKIVRRAATVTTEAAETAATTAKVKRQPQRPVQTLQAHRTDRPMAIRAVPIAVRPDIVDTVGVDTVGLDVVRRRAATAATIAAAVTTVGIGRAWKRVPPARNAEGQIPIHRLQL